jgi:cell division protein FtsL
VSPRSRGASRRGPRGRSVVALALLAFVLMAAAVVWRRSYGIARTRELQVLDVRRRQLEAEHAALRSAVRLAASRARIGTAAEERLGMRVPSDTQVVILARPTARPARGGTPGDSMP